jgi:nucleoside-diphosphate-sugar epimerase
VHGDGVHRAISLLSRQRCRHLLACEEGHEHWRRVFNIACGRRITINTLVQTINELWGTRWR